MATSPIRPVQAEVITACPAPDISRQQQAGPKLRDFRELDRQAILDGVTQNMVTPIELIQKVIDGMAERGFGRIVNITSLSVYQPTLGLDLSSGARAGLTSFLAGIARSVIDRNVTINQLLPGKLDTDRIRDTFRFGADKAGRTMDEERARQEKLIPAAASARRRNSARPALSCAPHTPDTSPARISASTADFIRAHSKTDPYDYAERKDAACNRKTQLRTRPRADTKSGGCRLFFHQYPRAGKLEIQATKPLGNQRDLALAYSPGVAAPCLAIADGPRQGGRLLRRAPISSPSSPTAPQFSASAILARSPPSR